MFTTAEQSSTSKTSDSLGDRREALADIGKRLRDTLRRGAQCEIRVAVEVIALAARWDGYQEEAGGLEIGAWLKKHVHPTRKLKDYKLRAQAADWAKPTGLVSRVESGLLVWLYNACPSESALAACAKELHRVYKENGDHLVTSAQGVKVCERFITRSRTRQRAHEQIRALKARVQRLEAQLRDLGHEPVE